MLRSIARSGASTLRRGQAPRTAPGPRFSRCQTTAREPFNLNNHPSPGSDYLRAESARPLSLSELSGFLDAQENHTPSDEGRTDASASSRSRLEEPDEFPDESEHPESLALRVEREHGRTLSKREKDAHLDELYAALNTKNPARLLDAATAAFHHEAIIETLSPTTVHEIFRALDLEAIIMRYHEISRHLSPKAIAMASKAGSPVRQVSSALDMFNSSFSGIVRQWQRGSQDLSVPIYKTLLRLAALVGDADSARAIRSMMKQNGHDLDVESTNSYLRALCWHKSYGRNFILNRVTPKRRPGTEVATFNLAAKNEVFQAFDDLIEAGHAANAETFSLLALAMGRTGDLDGVADLLNKIWDVQVSEVLEGKMDSLLFKNDLHPEDPLHPNPEVLFDLAHIYGTNNRFSDALRLVDFISRKYSVPIPLKAWEEITRWCFILSVPRNRSTEVPWRRELNEALTSGHVSVFAMEELWKTMTSEPYQIKPTLAMWDWRLKVLWRRRTYTQRWMRLFKSLVSELKLDQTSWPRAFDKKAPPGAPAKYHRVGGVSIGYELALLDELWRSTFAFKWIRLHLTVKQFNVDRVAFVYRKIPNILGSYINIWFQNTAKAIHYFTPTGRVHFHRNMRKVRLMPVEKLEVRKSLKLVRPTQQSLQLPFIEQTFAQRRNDISEARYQRGESKAGELALEWYEEGRVRDWIWFADGTGALVHGGHFDGPGRKYRLNDDYIKALTAEQQDDIKRRLMGQDGFYWKSIAPGGASHNPAPSSESVAPASVPS